MDRKFYELLAIWQAAKAEPLGLIILTNDPVACRAALYKARAEANDPELMDLELARSKWPAEGQWQITHVKRPPRRFDIDLSDVLDLD